MLMEFCVGGDVIVPRLKFICKGVQVTTKEKFPNSITNSEQNFLI
jgi:hypothetical protein